MKLQRKPEPINKQDLQQLKDQNRIIIFLGIINIILWLYLFI